MERTLPIRKVANGLREDFSLRERCALSIISSTRPTPAAGAELEEGPPAALAPDPGVPLRSRSSPAASRRNGPHPMELLGSINDLLWHPAMLFAVLATGLTFTVWSRFCQARAVTLGVRLLRGQTEGGKATGAISHFQALSTALSATVGLGNIAGVAIAVSLGGPGAVFWMWVTGVVGMALKTTEVTQAMLYRNAGPGEEPHGGAMWVASKGFARRWPRHAWIGKALAAAFAVALLVSTVTGGNMFQAWNVADITWSYFGVPRWLTGLAMTALVAAVIVGGIRRIGSVAGKLVPFMCGAYLLAGLAVVALNAGEVPAMLALIVRSAFTPAEAGGAFLGGAAGWAFIKGMQRALFSSEAGQGSSPIAHSAVRTAEPASEGVVAGLEPFIDTLVVCTITALVILLTGTWNRDADLAFGAPPQLTRTAEGSWTLEPTPLSWSGGGASGIRERVFTVVETDVVGETGFTHERVYADVRAGDGDAPTAYWEPIVSGASPRITVDGAFFDYKGATLTARAFDRAVPGLGYWLVPLTAWLFAVSTVISWNYYGEQGTIYLFGRRAVPAYRLVYCSLILLATTPLLRTEVELDDLSTFGTGVMLLTNLPILWLFAGEAMRAHREYVRRQRA